MAAFVCPQASPETERFQILDCPITTMTVYISPCVSNVAVSLDSIEIGSRQLLLSWKQVMKEKTSSENVWKQKQKRFRHSLLCSNMVHIQALPSWAPSKI
jgi:hypothetical protein